MLRNHGVHLKGLYESMGAVACCEMLKEALIKKELKPEDFSVREIAESFLGHEWVRRLNPSSQHDGLIRAEEAAVDVTAFANITGQIFYTKVFQGYEQADAGLFDRLCTVVPTTLSGEKIPGVGRIKDEEFIVPDGMPFPETGFGEDYQETPVTTKRGEIISLTKETIFFDRTGLVLKRAGEIGERQATGRLKRLLKVVIGAVNNYKWRGTSYNTYLTSGNWINDAGSNELVDWTNVEKAELLFADMLDPDTGNPIEIPQGKELLVPPAKMHTARRIIHATELRQGSQSGDLQTYSSNTIAGYGEPIVSALFYALLKSELSLSAANAKKYWITGGFKQAFWYMQNWPLAVVQAPPNAEAEFERDIVARWRCSERGVAAVGNPRFVVISKN